MAWIELSLAEQMECAKSNYVSERIAFSKYPVLPEVADFMIESGFKNGFARICANLFEIPNSDIWPKTLAKAAKKKVELCGIDADFDNALVKIALHLNTDVDTLKYLFELNDIHINWGLANNPNTPKAILTELAKINHHEINYALMCNPNTTEEIRDNIDLPSGFYTGYYYELQGVKVVASGN